MSDTSPEALIYDGLRRGDGVLVTFGSAGTQYAVVYSHARPGHHAKVVKWRKASKSWTKPVRLFREEFIRRANSGEFKAGPIPASVWGGR